MLSILEYRHNRVFTRIVLMITVLVVCCTGIIPVFTTQVCAESDLYAFNKDRSPRELIAERLILMGTSMYNQSRLDESLKMPCLTMTDILLDMATELNTQDPELWYMRAQIAKELDNHEEWEQAHRRYIRLRPEDDTAQLLLIQSHLTSLETLDDRLMRLENILTTKSSSKLSNSLRSYLAGLAAEAARELGDTIQFAKWLKYATSLDKTNSLAALMMVEFARERNGSPLQIGASLINLIQAAPLVAAPRVQLAQILASEAVYNLAAEQYLLAMNMGGQRLPVDSERNLILCMGASGMDSEALSYLRSIEKLNNAPEDETISDRSDSQKPLPPELQVLRLAITYDAANPESAATSLSELKRTIENDSETDTTQKQKELAWITAIFDQDPSAVSEHLESLNDIDHLLVQRATGWMHLRTGNQQQAREIFELIADTDPPSAYGLALMTGMDDAGKSRALREVIRQFPLSLGAMLSARELIKMERPIEPTTTGSRLLDMIGYKSPQLWSMNMKATEWLQMRNKCMNPRAGILEPLPIEITVRNVSPLPLSIGSAGTINSSLILSTASFSLGHPITSSFPSFEVNIGRKLALQPGESIVVNVDLKRYAVGNLTYSFPNVSFTVNVSSMLHPIITPAGPVPGPLGSTDIIRAIQTWGLPETDENIQLWLRQLDSHDITKQLEAISHLLSMVTDQPNEDEEQQIEQVEQIDRIAEAINQRFPLYQTIRQVWTVLSLTNEKDHGNAKLQRVFDLAKRSDDEMVRISYLFMHVKDLDSPALADALRDANPRIQRFANALKQILEFNEEQEEFDDSTEDMWSTP